MCRVGVVVARLTCNEKVTRSIRVSYSTMASRKPRLFRALSTLVCTSSRHSDSASTLIGEPIGKYERSDPIVDAQFDAAELQREKEFADCLANDAARYAFEESQQWENEHRRNDDLTTLKRQLEGAITEDQERRDKAFEAAQNSQGYAFSDHDHARQRRFDEGQKKRLEIFEKSYQAWETESEWHNGVQDAAIQASRQALSEISQELKQALQQQHESLLEEQEKKFLEGEKRRAEAYKAALELSRTGNSGQAQEDDSGKVDVLPEANLMLPASPYLGHYRPYSLARSRSSSRSSLCRGRSPRSRSRSRSPSPRRPACCLPIGNGRDYLSTLSEESTDNKTLKQHTPSPDEKFQLAQEDRDRRFQEEERRREQEFISAERDRDEAEDERNFEFQDLRRLLEGNLETELREYQSTFDQSERLRNQAENKRSEEYNAQQKLMNAQLDILLAKLTNRNKSRSTVVTTLYQSLDSEIMSLVTKLDGAIIEAEDNRRRRFKEGQAQIAGTLGDGIPKLNAPEDMDFSLYSYKLPVPFFGGQATPYTPWPAAWPAPIGAPYFPPPMPINMPPYVPYPGAYTPAWMETPSPRPQPLIIPGSAPCMIPPPHSPPSYDIQPVGKYPQSPPSAKAKGKKDRTDGHQEAYETSRWQRSTTFYQGLFRRRNTFDAAEAKRQHVFRIGQRKRQDEAEGLLSDQARRFRTAQNERQSRFLAAEETRARDFNTKEGYRMNTFQCDQLSREQRFHNSVNATTPDCLRHEDERVAALRRWVDFVLAGEKRGTEQYFAAVEKKRDEVFQRLLDLTFKRSNKD